MPERRKKPWEPAATGRPETEPAGKRDARKLEGKSIQSFVRGFNSVATRKSYYKRLGQFLEFHKDKQADELLEKAMEDPRFAEHAILYSTTKIISNLWLPAIASAAVTRRL